MPSKEVIKEMPPLFLEGCIIFPNKVKHYVEQKLYEGPTLAYMEGIYKCGKCNGVFIESYDSENCHDFH